jgi:hypothetical protein
VVCNLRVFVDGGADANADAVLVVVLMKERRDKAFGLCPKEVSGSHVHPKMT